MTKAGVLATWAIIGISVALVAWAVNVVWSPFNESHDITAEDANAIAKYKKRIAEIDLPLIGGKIAGADLPRAFQKVIDYDVRIGDMESARKFVKMAMQRNMDAQVLELCQVGEAKELIGQIQNARRKLQLLKEILSRCGTVNAKKDAADDPNLMELVDLFVQVPFSPSASPEHSQDIARLYKSQVGPLMKKIPILGMVAEDIEKNCLPADKE